MLYSPEDIVMLKDIGKKEVHLCFKAKIFLVVQWKY